MPDFEESMSDSTVVGDALNIIESGPGGLNDSVGVRDSMTAIVGLRPKDVVKNISLPGSSGNEVILIEIDLWQS